MNVQKRILSSKVIPASMSFTKCMSLEKKNRFQPILKPYTATCKVCKKGFVTTCKEKDFHTSRVGLQLKNKPTVCRDCDKSFVRTTGVRTPHQSTLDGPQIAEKSSVCFVTDSGRSIDEQLTNTHISKEAKSHEKDDEWVIVKVGENNSEIETEKVFSIKLCDEECNEESMVFQAGEEEIGNISSVVVSEDSEEDMMTQGSDSSVDIIQIGSLSFGSSCSDSDSLGYISQTSDATSSSMTFGEVDHGWSVCTKKFTTGVGKLDNWTVCTKGFSISGESSHVCQLCHKYFKNESDLKFHMVTHSSVQNQSVSSFQGHTEKVSSDSVREGAVVHELHTCSICHKAFSDASSLKSHAKIHSVSLSDNPTNAFKKVSQKGLLNKNSFIQANEKILACTICGARFQHKQQFAKHTKAHLILTCKVCQHVFKSSAKLKKHMQQVCGNVSASAPVVKSNEIPSTSQSSNVKFVKIKDASILDSDEKTKDVRIHRGVGKVLEKNVKKVKNYLVVDNQMNLNIEGISIASEEKECDISPFRSAILFKDIKAEQDIDIEDFPMVEDYYLVDVNEGVSKANSDEAINSVKEKKNTSRKNRCKK